MSTDSRSQSARVDELAADWLARQDSGQWSDEDQSAFDAWQNESTLHKVAVIRLRVVWRQADRLQALGAGGPPGEVPPPGQWLSSPLDPTVRRSAVSSKRNRTDRRKLRRWGISAFAAAAVLALLATLHDPDTYRTEIGATKTVHLRDGSAVTLNTNSRIHVALSADERRVKLERGEAFFEVAKDPLRPFVVEAGDQRVVAVGTKFSVLREAGKELRVVVTEGKVRVEQLQTALTPVQIAAGSVARAGAAGVVVTEHSLPEVEQAMSWRSGYIVLRETALADVVAEFNRYNERQLKIEDPALAGLRIGGNLRLTNLDAFVRVLEQGFPIQAEVDGDQILLRTR